MGTTAAVGWQYFNIDVLYNVCKQDRHWLARSVKHPLGNDSIRIIDETYRNRSEQN